MLPEQIISCDWGTSSLRIRLVSLADGKVLAHIFTSDGIARVAAAWSASQPLANSKPLFYINTITEKLAELPARTSDNVPLLISGMAASTIGFCELGYGKLPLSLEDPQLIVRQFATGELVQGPVSLVSGLRTGNDVMRGEETLIVGISPLDSAMALIILPGTHSKHAVIREKMVTDFKTFMTGELFSTLRHHTVLKHSMTPVHSALDPGAFAR
ncbi:MAG TPA: 2-dehydro-3-deoxygalactonokinase, partial [Chitinophagaceae bacterium]